ncbi:MAG TPA: glucosyl-3-phosphoglycerate synthase [Solirubrobacterales bacterium]|nr:glucosyl-3-phosphoglycerate synthase [Solirubrobacterales bacterium]
MELSAPGRDAVTRLGAALPPPGAEVRAVVIIPAHDEEERIGSCLGALVAQVEVDPAWFEVIVVIDDCHDGTEAMVDATRASLGVDGPKTQALLEFSAHRPGGPAIHVVAGPGQGAGPARATGMDVGCARLESLGRRDGLLASTDADSTVAPDWIARQLEAIAAGAEAIGGEVILDPVEAAALPPSVLARREADLAARTRAAAARGPAEHAHFSGASLGVTPRAYRRAGGMAWMAALEDQELEDRLAAAGVRIHRLRPVSVITAARTDGRAERGLARDLELGRWLAERRYDGAAFSLPDLLAAKTTSIAAILPTRECAATIGPILERLTPLREAGLVDELLVVDADSADGTAAIALERGARTLLESTLRPELGPGRGKGDAMWRAAAATEAELLVFIDADTVDFDPAFLTGLVGPMLADPDLALVKGTFRRPLALGGAVAVGEGGRVTELVARPLLNLHFPALAGFAQPLAGEVAIRRDLFERLSVPVGYGVEIAMLIDALGLVGLDALAEADLGARQNTHQSLRALSAMAGEVMVAVERRTGGAPRPSCPAFRPRPEEDAGSEIWRLRCEERPPLASILADRSTSPYA